ncbi:MAG: hypothetical protein SNJ74_07130 [Fimbriimonadaceae bacterium]
MHDFLHRNAGTTPAPVGHRSSGASPDDIRVARRARSGPERLRVAMAALFAPGAPRRIAVPPSKWPAVFRALAGGPDPIAGGPARLAQAGIGEAAILLDDPELLAWAQARVGSEASETRVVTVACPNYPTGWLERLGNEAPPAFWLRSNRPNDPIDVAAAMVPVEEGPAGPGADSADGSILFGLAERRRRLAVAEAGPTAGWERADRLGLPPRIVVLFLPFGRRPSPWPGSEGEAGVGASDAVWIGGTQTARDAAFLAFGSLTVVGPGTVGPRWQHALLGHRRARRGPIAVWDGPGCGFRHSLLRLGAIPFHRIEDLGRILEEIRPTPCALPEP